MLFVRGKMTSSHTGQIAQGSFGSHAHKSRPRFAQLHSTLDRLAIHSSHLKVLRGAPNLLGCSRLQVKAESAVKVAHPSISQVWRIPYSRFRHGAGSPAPL